MVASAFFARRTSHAWSLALLPAAHPVASNNKQASSVCCLLAVCAADTQQGACARLDELLAGLHAAPPPLDPEKLQADFQEFSRRLRNQSTRLVCCGCGEGCSVGGDIVCDRDAGTPTVFSSTAFSAIEGFKLLMPRPGAHQAVVCKRCIKPLRDGVRPQHAYHFPPPDPWLDVLNPAELQLVKPCVVMTSIRRLFGGGGGAVQYSSIHWVRLRMAERCVSARYEAAQASVGDEHRVCGPKRGGPGYAQAGHPAKSGETGDPDGSRC